MEFLFDEMFEFDEDINLNLTLVESGYLPHKSTPKITYDMDISDTPSDKNNPCGLINIGSICYLNSILQCLSVVLTGMNPQPHWNNMVKEFFAFIRSMQTTKGKNLNPTFLCHYIEDYCIDCGNISLVNQPQDGHEFLIFLLDALRDNIKNDSNLINSFLMEQIVTETYEGCLCTYKHIVTRRIPTIGLSIDVKNFTNFNTLNECVNNYFEKSYVVDPVECPKCKCSAMVSQEYRIEKLPNILILHMKKFDNYQKLQTAVDFPFTNFNIPHHKQMYDLYAICNHIGNKDWGHYTSSIRKDDAWYHCNDGFVSATNPTNIKIEDLEDAYILFYKLQNNNPYS